MSSATFVGSLDKRICTFSPRTFVPSVVTAFCVDVVESLIDAIILVIILEIWVVSCL